MPISAMLPISAINVLAAIRPCDLKLQQVPVLYLDEVVV